MSRPRSTAAAICIALAAAVALSFAVLSVASDLEALRAAFGIRGLCGLFLAALVLSLAYLRVYRRRAGEPHPLLSVALLVGLFLAVMVAGQPLWEVASKNDAPSPAPPLPPSRSLSLADREVAELIYVEADLRDSDLSGATIRSSNLQGARLDESNLRGATLDSVNLANAFLCGVDVREADLSGVENLSKAEDMRFLVYDENTIWPEDFEVSAVNGPVLFDIHDVLYTCDGTTVSRIEAGDVDE